MAKKIFSLKTIVTYSKYLKTHLIKSLFKKVNRSKGRNLSGKITIRHRGGGHKKLYRKIDFLRKSYNISSKVIRIEYDPFRSSYIALLQYNNGEYKYILCPNSLKIGQTLISSNDNFFFNIGNAFPLKLMPIGLEIHNIELYPGKGAQLVRSAGNFAKIILKNKGYVLIEMPSKELRLINENCFATIGRVSNPINYLRKYKKAGNMRWLGLRPKVRGSAMNPIDHPHGGGEGKSSIGKIHPVTPWGKPTLGFRTRKKKNKSDKYIVKRRYDKN